MNISQVLTHRQDLVEAMLKLVAGCEIFAIEFVEVRLPGIKTLRDGAERIRHGRSNRRNHIVIAELRIVLIARQDGEAGVGGRLQVTEGAIATRPSLVEPEAAAC